MTDPQGPWGLQETVDRLENDIVDVESLDDATKAGEDSGADDADDSREAGDAGGAQRPAADPSAEDLTRRVPGAPEPPD